MASKKKVVVVKQKVVVPNNGVVVEEHLDRDLNDPRNRPETPKLPSLND